MSGRGSVRHKSASATQVEPYVADCRRTGQDREW